MTTFENDDVQVWTCPDCSRDFRVLKENFSGHVLHHCGVAPKPSGMQGAGDLLATVIKVASGGLSYPRINAGESIDKQPLLRVGANTARQE